MNYLQINLSCRDAFLPANAENPGNTFYFLSQLRTRIFKEIFFEYCYTLSYQQNESEAIEMALREHANQKGWNLLTKESRSPKAKFPHDAVDKAKDALSKDDVFSWFETEFYHRYSRRAIPCVANEIKAYIELKFTQLAHHSKLNAEGAKKFKELLAPIHGIIGSMEDALKACVVDASAENNTYKINQFFLDNIESSVIAGFYKMKLIEPKNVITLKSEGGEPSLWFHIGETTIMCLPDFKINQLTYLDYIRVQYRSIYDSPEKVIRQIHDDGNVDELFVLMINNRHIDSLNAYFIEQLSKLAQFETFKPMIALLHPDFLSLVDQQNRKKILDEAVNRGILSIYHLAKSLQKWFQDDLVIDLYRQLSNISWVNLRPDEVAIHASILEILLKNLHGFPFRSLKSAIDLLESFIHNAPNDVWQLVFKSEPFRKKDIFILNCIKLSQPGDIHHQKDPGLLQRSVGILRRLSTIRAHNNHIETQQVSAFLKVLTADACALEAFDYQRQLDDLMSSLFNTVTQPVWDNITSEPSLQQGFIDYLCLLKKNPHHRNLINGLIQLQQKIPTAFWEIIFIDSSRKANSGLMLFCEILHENSSDPRLTTMAASLANTSSDSWGQIYASTEYGRMRPCDILLAGLKAYPRDSNLARAVAIVASHAKSLTLSVSYNSSNYMQQPLYKKLFEVFEMNLLNTYLGDAIYTCTKTYKINLKSHQTELLPWLNQIFKALNQPNRHNQLINAVPLLVEQIQPNTWHQSRTEDKQFFISTFYQLLDKYPQQLATTARDLLIFLANNHIELNDYVLLLEWLLTVTLVNKTINTSILLYALTPLVIWMPCLTVRADSNEPFANCHYLWIIGNYILSDPNQLDAGEIMCDLVNGLPPEAWIQPLQTTSDQQPTFLQLFVDLYLQKQSNKQLIAVFNTILEKLPPAKWHQPFSESEQTPFNLIYKAFLTNIRDATLQNAYIEVSKKIPEMVLWKALNNPQECMRIAQSLTRLMLSLYSHLTTTDNASGFWCSACINYSRTSVIATLQECVHETNLEVAYVKWYDFIRRPTQDTVLLDLYKKLGLISDKGIIYNPLFQHVDTIRHSLSSNVLSSRLV